METIAAEYESRIPSGLENSPFLAKNEIVVPEPRHDEIKRGTLIAIITEAGLTKDEFLKLL